MSDTINIRNPKFLADGRIDCEIEHPVFGWVPFTANANDSAEHGRAIHAAAVLMVPAPYVPQPPAPPAVPQVVTMRQARLALLAAGLLPQVDDAINALTEPQRTAARIEWDYSSEVHRDKPFVQMLGTALGLTDEDLDSLFTQAAQL